jgi:hypothetical protein
MRNKKVTATPLYEARIAMPDEPLLGARDAA